MSQGNNALPLDKLEELKRTYEDHQEWLFITSQVMRPGVMELCVEVEHGFFPPSTPANDEYQLGLLSWPAGTSLLWTVFTVPWQFEPTLAQVAGRFRLTLIDAQPMALETEGLPPVIVGARPGQLEVAHREGFKPFPIGPKRLRYLEGKQGVEGKAAITGRDVLASVSKASKMLDRYQRGLS